MVPKLACHVFPHVMLTCPLLTVKGMISSDSSDIELLGTAPTSQAPAHPETSQEVCRESTWGHSRSDSRKSSIQSQPKGNANQEKAQARNYLDQQSQTTKSAGNRCCERYHKETENVRILRVSSSIPTDFKGVVRRDRAGGSTKQSCRTTVLVQRSVLGRILMRAVSKSCALLVLHTWR